jgi:hypothetical protein
MVDGGAAVPHFLPPTQWSATAPAAPAKALRRRGFPLPRRFVTMVASHHTLPVADISAATHHTDTISMDRPLRGRPALFIGPTPAIAAPPGHVRTAP